MCLAIPTQIVKLLDNQMALTSLSGVEKEISLSLLQEYSKCSFENVRSKMIESSRMMTPKF